MLRFLFRRACERTHARSDPFAGLLMGPISVTVGRCFGYSAGARSESGVVGACWSPWRSCSSGSEVLGHETWGMAWRASAHIVSGTMAEDEISEEGAKDRFARWDQIGLDLLSGGHRLVGGPPSVRALAWKWVRTKEAEQASDAAHNKPPADLLTLKPTVWGYRHRSQRGVAPRKTTVEGAPTLTPCRRSFWRAIVLSERCRPGARPRI
jgi:hypothetical protein